MYTVHIIIMHVHTYLFVHEHVYMCIHVHHMYICTCITRTAFCTFHDVINGSPDWSFAFLSLVILSIRLTGFLATGGGGAFFFAESAP